MGTAARRSRAVRQIRRAQPWQELFCRRTKRIAEFHQLVEPRDDSVFRAEIHDGLVFRGRTQVTERVDEESCSATHLIAEHGNAGARMVVGFDDDVFELVAQVLLDGGFVLLLDFSVIGQHADGAKILPPAALVGGKKFLHCIRGVSTIVQDLRERRMPRAKPRQRIAERGGLFRQGITLLAQSGDPGLKLRGALFQRIELTGSGFMIVSRALGIIARTQRSFQQVALVSFELPQRFGLVYKRFFGLLLLAMQAQQAFAGFR